MNRFYQLIIITCLNLVLFTPLIALADIFQQPVDLKGSDFLTVIQKLQHVNVMRGNFSQRKQIKILKRPLISKGFMLFSNEQGLYWRIESPLNSIMVFTKQGIFEKHNDSVSRQKQANIGNLFSAIFAGDIKTLNRHFAIYFSIQADNWNIGLMPKTAMLQKVFRKIILKGKQQVEEIFIEELRGDTTLLQFSGIKTLPTELTLAEEKYFDF